ncbi:protein of unknown function [Ruminococcaceae bacterium BL-6]|nr:protein of unknown function [Ruminococcaceae bacterium BL-6]
MIKLNPAYNVLFELPNRKPYDPVKSRNIKVSCKDQNSVESIVKNMFGKVKILKIEKDKGK